VAAVPQIQPKVPAEPAEPAVAPLTLELKGIAINPEIFFQITMAESTNTIGI
jgi:hypothetical protein